MILQQLIVLQQAKISTAGPLIAGMVASFPSSLLKFMIYDPPAAHRAATGINFSSVADPGHFGTDPDPDTRIHASD
jgi:hypothetical protein